MPNVNIARNIPVQGNFCFIALDHKTGPFLQKLQSDARGYPQRRKFHQAGVFPGSHVSNPPRFPHAKLFAGNHDRLQLITSLPAAISFGYWPVVWTKARVAQKRANGIGDSSGKNVLEFTGGILAFIHMRAQDIADESFRKTVTMDIAPKLQTLILSSLA